ncbi:TsoY family (seleno)protein [Thalassovita mediterranea]|jgi:hypothetical protein|uniref:Uncharacterized protein n=1 Tax=Thalassovita mediterranea TaxID=340021 RepID=A0A0N7M1B6_9RHOB|nr:hypothetical protein [Thalassovita mediterranea]CUH82851.1 hypothetical protein TM5383_00033 [Thalassovita mediterranea]SIS31514.1 hypothetical protein SAMN05421685_104239 [Thalassovita mediterranea]
MASQLKRPADSYNPLYFLASLGAGGLSVTFFMYLMFWVPHPDQPVPLFADIARAFQTGTLMLQAAIVIAVLGIAFFAFLNIKTLLWNLSALRQFQMTEGYKTLTSSNAEATLLAAPLAMAMTVNALFIVGMVFVPNLWSVVEYLFPMALLAFSLIGIWALRLMGRYLGRVFGAAGQFSLAGHNSFAQLMPAFALSMVGVGMSAPAAMSHNQMIVIIALLLSTFFAVVAVIYALFAAITAVSAMLQHGTAKEAGPTLMVIVPLMTVLGILSFRQSHGLHTTFGSHGDAADGMMFFARMLSVQLTFLGLGMVVLLRQGYFKDYVFGRQTSPGSYALICPGVALSVMIHFFLNKGLVAAGAVDKFSLTYWAVTALALAAQFAMIALVLRLNRQHFRGQETPQAVPAE